MQWTAASLLLPASFAAGRTAPTVSGTGIGFDPACTGHLAGRRHPERPERLNAIMRSIEESKLGGRLVALDVRHADERDVLLCHTEEYLATVRSDVAQRDLLSTGDTELSSHSLSAAFAAAGVVLSAVDAVMSGAVRNAFCAVRPPGHHASAARGMGFCIFNNVAIGARHARERHGVKRVLIADWDVHHGNGTQDIFWSDGGVLFFDTHQHPWYPGTGKESEKGSGKGYGLIINRPFPAGAGRKEILGAFRDTLVPAAHKFKPELVMISAGFDSRQGDPLGGFTLTDRDFADLTDIVLDIAARHAGGKLVSVLEGGYALDGLASASLAHTSRLAAAAGAD